MQNFINATRYGSHHHAHSVRDVFETVVKLQIYPQLWKVYGFYSALQLQYFFQVFKGP